MLRTIILLLLSLGIALSVVACGSAEQNDNASASAPTRAATNTATVSPLSTATVVPSPTPAETSLSTPCTEAKKPIITKPVEGGSVALTDIISGTTPCAGMKHYLVVTPVENSINWVQDKPFNIDSKGSFTSEAQFGEGSNGVGKKFLVRILVTKATLSAGQLAPMPADAILSGAVSVTREH